MAALGDPHACWRIASGKSPKTAAISCAGLQVELVAVVAQPLGVVDRLAGADAEQDVVRLEVGVLQVVDVVGARRAAGRGRCAIGCRPMLTMRCSSMPWYCISRKKLLGARGCRGRPPPPAIAFCVLLGADPGRDLALEAAAEADQALRVLRQQLLVDARLVVEPLGVARRHELDEVVVALVASPRAGPGDSPSRPACRSSSADRRARRRPRSRGSG